MQRIIKGNELLKYIDEAITTLSDAVKVTVGPNGNNVIINESNYTPYITNDGATIAAALASEDEITNTIISIIKEAALKTEADVGDGTTTTIILLESIYKNSLKYIKTSNNALTLKDELNKSTKRIIAKLENFSHQPSNQELEKIASISANDNDIGSLITKFYLTLNKSDNIKLLENTINSKDYVQKLSGYFLKNVLASLYFFKEKEITVKNPLLILFSKEINFTQELEKIIYDANNLNKDLIIIADSFSDSVINDILALNYETKQKIILLNNPEYGTRRLDIIADLSILSRAQKYADYYLGNIQEFKHEDETSTIIYDNLDEPNKYLDDLKDSIRKETDEYELAFLKDRLSKLTSTYGLIYIGGNTQIERREKKMRFTDALCALNASQAGIVPGSSLPFYQISEELVVKNTADAILKEALKAPLIQILKNSSVNHTEIISQIKENNYQIIYNAKNKAFESLNNTNVLDNKTVLTYALTNATSIASLLLTTSHLVINTTKTNLNIENLSTEI